MIINPMPLFGRAHPPYRVEDVFRIVTATGANLQSAIDAEAFAPDLIIAKSYSAVGDWVWRDTVRGLDGSKLVSSSDSPMSSFSGYSGAALHVAYLFRRKRDFLDVLTFEGSGSPQSVPHALGSVPGFLIQKNIDAASYWVSMHRSSTRPGGHPNVSLINNYIANQTAGQAAYFPSYPTASAFSVGTESPNFNPAGNTMEAFIFGHVEGSHSVIQCGLLETAGASSGDGDIRHGWPEGAQFLMIRSIGGPSSYCWIVDRARAADWSSAAALRLGHVNAEGGGPTVTADTGGVLSVSGLSLSALTYQHEYLIIRNAA